VAFSTSLRADRAGASRGPTCRTDNPIPHRDGPIPPSMDQHVNDNTKPSTSAIRAGNGFFGDGVSHRTKRLFAVHGVVTAAAAVIFFGSPPALADPVDVAPQHYSKVIRDGWNLDILIQGERINSVPNLAAAVNSREAFVTVSATATATGGLVPITDSVFVVGYQLGCQTDVSSGLQIGGVGSIAPLASIGAPLANPVTGASANVGVGVGISGFVQTILQPGV
jgi:hypothetical protein